jgi:hypothetical protein
MLLRKAAQVGALFAMVGIGFIMAKGAVMFAILLLTKSMISLMAYPIALTTLTAMITALLEHQLLIAAIVGPFLLAPYLFRKFAFVTGLTSNEHPYSATQCVKETFQGLLSLLASLLCCFKKSKPSPAAESTSDHQQSPQPDALTQPGTPPLLVSQETRPTASLESNRFVENGHDDSLGYHA